jgi:predicted RNA-binding protein
LHYLWFEMCEFNVIIDGKIQFRDVINIKVDGENVTVKNILGQAQEFKGYKILEVDVPNTRLVLLPIKH